MRTEIHQLTIKFLEGTASREEAGTLFDYVIASPENMKEFRTVEEFWKRTHIPSEEVLNSLKSLKSNIRQHKRRQTLRRIAVWSTAAASLILVAFLTGRLVGKYHASVNDGALVQEYVVEVPMGMNTRVSLPDGTNVMINAGSRLSYTSEFNKTTRDVILSGEAYFEVAKNEKIPFNVQAGECTISVLGTKFDISAYDCDAEVLTALMEGSVRFSKGEHTGILKPGELATFNNDSLIVQKTDVEQYRGWTKGLIKYNDISFATLLKRLEREYNTTLVLEDADLASRNIRVSFRREDSIDTIMKVLSDILPIATRKDGRAYYVTRKD